MGKTLQHGRLLITGGFAAFALTIGVGTATFAKDGTGDAGSSNSTTTTTGDSGKSASSSTSTNTQTQTRTESNGTGTSQTNSTATSGSSSSSTRTQTTTRDSVTSTTDKQSEKSATTDQSDSTTRPSAEELKQRADDRLDTMKAQMDTRRDAIKDHLAGDRLKKCEDHQNAINMIITNGKTHAQEILTRLQTTEAHVRSFYASKNVTLDNYDTLSNAIDDSEASAIAAVSASGSETFTCSADDADNPAGIEKDGIKTVVTALDTYRDAIRALITAIRQKLDPNDTGATSEPSQSTSQSSTVGTSGGAQ